MLTIKPPSHTTHHNDPEKENSQRQKRSSYENAVLKAYEIIPVREYSLSSQEESVADLKPSQARWKARNSSVTWKNETPSNKSRGKDQINDKQTQNWTGQARTAAQARKKEYENDVLKAYGIFSAALAMFS